jgi:hypothetical protein
MPVAFNWRWLAACRCCCTYGRPGIAIRYKCDLGPSLTSCMTVMLDKCLCSRQHCQSNKLLAALRPAHTVQQAHLGPILPKSARTHQLGLKPCLRHQAAGTALLKSNQTLTAGPFWLTGSIRSFCYRHNGSTQHPSCYDRALTANVLPSIIRVRHMCQSAEP